MNYDGRTPGIRHIAGSLYVERLTKEINPYYSNSRTCTQPIAILTPHITLRATSGTQRHHRSITENKFVLSFRRNKREAKEERCGEQSFKRSLTPSPSLPCPLPITPHAPSPRFLFTHTEISTGIPLRSLHFVSRHPTFSPRFSLETSGEPRKPKELGEVEDNYLVS